MLSPSTALFMDPEGGAGNCDQGLLNYRDMGNPYYEANLFFPCLPEWRIFNLQGDRECMSGPSYEPR